MSSICFYYQEDFIGNIICKNEIFENYQNFLDQIFDCNCILTKQMRTLILGHVVILNNEEFFNLKNKEYMTLLRYTFDLLSKQKSEESDKLKKELVYETDCNFLEEDDNDDHEKQ